MTLLDITHNTPLQTARAKWMLQHATVAEAACQTILDYSHAQLTPEFCSEHGITVAQLHSDMIVLAMRWANSRVIEAD